MKIYALCAVSAGVDTLRMIANQIPLAGVIGLTEREVTSAISGYTDMPSVSHALRLPFTPVSSYNLADAGDIERLKALSIDVLIVAGWQRLVPKWLIEHCRIGCIGAHGSPEGIFGGRGRSPQNWALIAGADHFEISIFFIDPGVDSGPVIGTRRFQLTDRDDIVSSYLKVNMSIADMLLEAFRSGAIAERRAQEQPVGAHYLPQRVPADGAIDWRRSAVDICRFVAALTRPYPGAFAINGDDNVTIWRARPFVVEHKPLEPGQVVFRSVSNQLIVQTGDGLVLIDDYETSGRPVETSTHFTSADFRAQQREIIDRHNLRYPEFPVSDLIRRLVQ